MISPHRTSSLRNILALGILAAAQTAFSATYYVATNGSDSNAGSSSSPFATIQKGLNTAQAGDTVQIAAGTYSAVSGASSPLISFPRSGTSSSALITLTAAPGATVTIDGANVIPSSSWSVDNTAPGSGLVYKASWSSKNYFGTWQTNPSDARDEARNQLFVNGTYIQEVASRANMFAGSFYFDKTNQLIYLWQTSGLSPSGQTVESDVTSGPLLNTNSQNYLQIKNLNFLHCANPPQGSAAVQINNGASVTMSNCTVQYAAGAGLHVGGTGNTVLNCTMNYNGQEGIHSNAAVNCLVQGCETSYNNTLAGKQFDPGWEAGGNKFALSNGVTVNQHLSHDNIGSGIWFDVSNQNGVITNSVVYGNGCGIHYEISYTGLIANNICYGNRLQGAAASSPAGDGIYISSSAGCLVYNNTSWGNDNRAINVSGPVRDDGSGLGRTVYSYATRVFNNSCAENSVANTNGSDLDVDFNTAADPALANPLIPFASNQCDYNLFYRPDTEHLVSGTIMGTYAAYNTSNFGQWQTATGFDLHSIIGDPLYVSTSTPDFHVAYNSPAIDAGTTISAVTSDYDGVARPQGPAYDIGAYEKPALFFQAESLTIPNYSGPVPRNFSESDMSGNAASIQDSTAVGNYVTYDVPNVSAQTYDVRIGVKQFNPRGIWQLRIGKSSNFSGTESSVGTPQDEYSATAGPAEYDLGTWTPGSTSDKWFQFMVTGKNSASSGYSMCFDYILLIPTN